MIDKNLIKLSIHAGRHYQFEKGSLLERTGTKTINSFDVHYYEYVFTPFNAKTFDIYIEKLAEEYFTVFKDSFNTQITQLYFNHHLAGSMQKH